VGAMIRESPTLASLGRREMDHVGGGGGGGGGYQVDSFFDVYTELSIDGGLTWMPAASAMHMVGAPEPGTLVLLITAGIGMFLFAWRRKKGERR
jgi:hypothetical protein